MGRVTIANLNTGETRDFEGDPRDEPFRRWVRDRARQGSVCDQPGTPGSSPACLSCTASCSSEPADVDPEEPPVDAISAATLAQWDLDRVQGDR